MMDRFTKRVKDNEGNPIGIEQPALFADHYLYEVSFMNDRAEELTANAIAENMIFQVDSQVHHYQVLKDISDHSADGSSLKISNGFIRSLNKNLYDKKTTLGYKLEVEWNDGTLKQTPLKYLKASNTVEITGYSVSNNIKDELAFKWWGKDALCKRDQIISKVKVKYWKTIHKFEIQFPKTVDKV